MACAAPRLNIPSRTETHILCVVFNNIVDAHAGELQILAAPRMQRVEPTHIKQRLEEEIVSMLLDQSIFSDAGR